MLYVIKITESESYENYYIGENRIPTEDKKFAVRLSLSDASAYKMVLEHDKIEGKKYKIEPY